MNTKFHMQVIRTRNSGDLEPSRKSLEFSLPAAAGLFRIGALLVE